MDQTPNLDLPYIMPSQAQKHVTHNEALRILDIVAQLSVIDRDLAAPPSSPAEGDRYIVAASPTGAWTGQAGKIAAWQDGGWAFSAPRDGWLAWVADEAALVYRSGSAWQTVASAITALQNLSLLGVGATADATNPFSAKLNKALWTARTAAEGGDGDLRQTLNKETAADVLSLLLQTGYSGRAELGLIGDDNLTLKVSPNGSSWTAALVVDRTTGVLKTVAGSAAAPALAFSGDADTGVFDAAADTLAFATGGSERARIDSAGLMGLGMSSPDVRLHVNGQIKSERAGGQAALIAYRSDGPRAANLGAGTTNTYFMFDNLGIFQVKSQATASILTSTTSGATNRMVIDGSSGNVGVGIDTPACKLDVDGAIRLKSYTIATLPSASPAGQMVYCSDLGGGSGQLHSDGTNWRRIASGGHQTVATDAALTLTSLVSAPEQKHTGTLTADRTITLSSTSAYAGVRFRVVRTGGGAFNLSVGGLKNLATNSVAEVIFDGSAWYLASYGTL